ncbi:hypothetical protein FSY60_07615 [Shigella sonnei]
MIHSYKDLSESRLVNAYASQIINAIRDDESMPGRMITIGNPAITASASWWGAFFGLSLSADDLDELKEIDL